MLGVLSLSSRMNVEVYNMKCKIAIKLKSGRYSVLRRDYEETLSNPYIECI